MKNTDRRSAGYGKEKNNAGRFRRSEEYKNTSANDGAAQNANEDIVCGRNAVKELLAGGRSVDKIMVQKGEREGSLIVLAEKAKAAGIPVIEAERRKLDDMCHGERHQGIVAMVATREYSSVEEIIEYAESLGEKPFIIICDGIEDPHNLGAIIRSAECSGVHGVIIPKRRAVGLTSVVAKTSAGAIEYMRIAKVSNIAETIERLKEYGIWVYAADMDGQNYSTVDFGGGCAIVLGSEGDGISRLTKERCDFVVSIPLYGHVDSLNVSNAAAVLMTEAARQRHLK